MPIQTHATISLPHSVELTVLFQNHWNREIITEWTLINFAKLQQVYALGVRVLLKCVWCSLNCFLFRSSIFSLMTKIMANLQKVAFTTSMSRMYYMFAAQAKLYEPIQTWLFHCLGKSFSMKSLAMDLGLVHSLTCSSHRKEWIF